MGKRESYDPGTFCSVDLATPDREGAKSFYGSLFGWGSQVMEAAGGPPYTIITVGERSNGGIRPLSPEEEEAGVPPHWIPYFDVESLEATIDRSGELGGAKLFGPMDFPAGRIAAVRDAQGAAFAIWEGGVQD